MSSTKARGAIPTVFKQSVRRFLAKRGFTLARTADLRWLVQQQGYTLYRSDDIPIQLDLCRDLRRLAQRVPLEIKTVFDVGANVGQTSRRFATAFPSAEIYAFEPISATFEQCERNTRDLARIKLFRLAMGASPGKATVHLKKYHLLNTLVEDLNQSASGTGVSEEIQVTTVDEFTAEHHIGRIDLLKTDTEGFDLNVLRGAKQQIVANNVVFILSEVGFRQSYPGNTSFFDLTEYLYDKNFRFYGLYDLAHHANGSTWANALFVNQTIVPLISEEPHIF